MRLADFVITAALAAALSGTATAQTAAPQPTTTTPQASATAAGQNPTATIAGPTRSHWLASGFAGSNFATNIEEVDLDRGGASFNFGAQIGYLWRGVLGAEALADFAPSLDVSSVAFEDNPSVSSYMANAIGTIPLGAEGQFQPYVSGGWGTIQMVADVPQFVTVQPVGATSVAQGSVRSTQTQFGTNIGGGLMAYAGHFGVRTDVRFYHSSSDDTPIEGTPADTVTQGLLSGLRYWRANIGVGFRW
jgi:hypothetical protein